MDSPNYRLFNRVFRFIVKYGGIVVALWVIFRTIFSDSIRNADSLVGGLSVLFLFLVFNILIAAFEIYFMFPTCCRATTNGNIQKNTEIGKVSQ